MSVESWWRRHRRRRRRLCRYRSRCDQLKSSCCVVLCGSMHEHRVLAASVSVAVRAEVGEALAVVVVAVTVMAAVPVSVSVRSALGQLLSRPVCRHA